MKENKEYRRRRNKELTICPKSKSNGCHAQKESCLLRTYNTNETKQVDQQDQENRDGLGSPKLKKGPKNWGWA